MNAEELGANPSLTEWTVMDLNDGGGANTPGGGGGGGAKVLRLPYDDSSFDVVLMQLSVDYLVRPLEVMREASRVLRGGGKIAVLFSNRLFLSKAVGLWTGSDDVDHAYTVGSYLHYCGGGFKNITAEDLSTRKRRVGGGGGERVIVGDPLYVVTATKGQ
jgi:SAM-dependent methyltransferase